MNVRESFQYQGAICGQLGSPFMAQLLSLIGSRLEENTQLGDAVLNWQGDPGPSGDGLALRLAGGLHALVLKGDAPDLQAVYPPQQVVDDLLWDAVSSALTTHAETLLSAIKSPPQTNELRRSGALLPGLLEVASRTGLPIVLSEVGASAGLNLGLDRFRVETSGFALGAEKDAAIITLRPDWEGGVPPEGALHIEAREGCDLWPIDVSNESERIRLLSYLWADQPERLAMTRSVIAGDMHPVVGEHAINFLTRRLAERHVGRVHVVMHSIAWQYLSAADKAEGDAIIQAAGRSATRDAPIARLSMEADDSGAPGAALDLTIWPGGDTIALARVDFHGRWIGWQKGS